MSGPIDPAGLLADSRRQLAQLPNILDALLTDLDDATARARPSPLEWAPVEIVCHLRDEETEDFAARLHAVLEGRTAFAPIDPSGWVAERRYREADLREELAQFRGRRAVTIAWLDTIVPDRLGSSVPHPAIGELFGLDLLVAWVTHDRLHLSQLAGTLGRLWSSRWAPLKAEYAGPIPYAPGLTAP